jgi:hypothetical protein
MYKTPADSPVRTRRQPHLLLGKHPPSLRFVTAPAAANAALLLRLQVLLHRLPTWVTGVPAEHHLGLVTSMVSHCTITSSCRAGCRLPPLCSSHVGRRSQSTPMPPKLPSHSTTSTISLRVAWSHNSAAQAGRH